MWMPFHPSAARSAPMGWSSGPLAPATTAGTPRPKRTTR